MIVSVIPIDSIEETCISVSSFLCFEGHLWRPGMADHFEVMAGRLLTDSTLQSAINEASALPSSATTACDAAAEDGRATSGVLVECRICQEEEDEAYMEAPCSCKGSLKVKRSITLILLRFTVSAILFRGISFQQYETC